MPRKEAHLEPLEAREVREEVVSVFRDTDAEQAVEGVGGAVAVERGPRAGLAMPQNPEEDLHLFGREPQPVDVRQGGRLPAPGAPSSASRRGTT